MLQVIKNLEQQYYISFDGKTNSAKGKTTLKQKKMMNNLWNEKNLVFDIFYKVLKIIYPHDPFIEIHPLQGVKSSP